MPARGDRGRGHHTEGHGRASTTSARTSGASRIPASDRGRGSSRSSARSDAGRGHRGASGRGRRSSSPGSVSGASCVSHTDPGRGHRGASGRGRRSSSPGSVSGESCVSARSRGSSHRGHTRPVSALDFSDDSFIQEWIGTVPSQSLMEQLFHTGRHSASPTGAVSVLGGMGDQPTTSRRGNGRARDDFHRDMFTSDTSGDQWRLPQPTRSPLDDFCRGSPFPDSSQSWCGNDLFAHASPYVWPGGLTSDPPSATPRRGQASKGTRSKPDAPYDLPGALSDLRIGQPAAGTVKSAKSRPDSSRTAQQTTSKPTTAATKPPITKATHVDNEPSGIQRPASVRTTSTATMDTRKAITKARQLMTDLDIRGTDNPKQDVDRFFDAEVKLMQKEKVQSGDCFNRLREIMLKKLKDMTPWSWKFLNSGSHYDGVKVSRADEMDCMFFPSDIPKEWLEVVHDGAPPEFCYIRLRAPRGVDKSDLKYSQLKDLCDGDRISSTLYRAKIFEAFEAGRKEHRHAKVDPDSKPGCPSFMVLLDTVPRSDGRRGRRTISIDLLPALHLEGWPTVSTACLRSLNKDDTDEIKRAGFHVIPKHCNDRAYSKTKHLLWRLSYSWAEKHLTLHADGVLNNPQGTTTCRKLVMRILKRMLEIFKELNNTPGWKEPNENMLILKRATQKLREESPLDFHVSKFTSFQIRTLMWNEYFTKHRESGHWAHRSRRGRLQDALTGVLDLLSGTRHIDHFFVPGFDIMKDVPRNEREYLYTLFYIAKEMF